MGKRQPNAARKARKAANKHDLWPTPYHAILPLLPHLEPGTRFLEPCAGDGRMIGYLQEHGHVCEGAWDIEPQDECIRKLDVRYLVTGLPREKLGIITNPPWSRPILHELIPHFAGQHDTWLLFDSGWAFTAQAEPFLKFCHKIVAVGRMRWLEGTENDKGMSSLDDCSFYFFTNVQRNDGPVFYGKKGELKHG